MCGKTLSKVFSLAVPTKTWLRGCVLDVTWLVVHCKDRSGLLAEITSTISEFGHDIKVCARLRHVPNCAMPHAAHTMIRCPDDLSGQLYST
eukprot:scaffold233068_cov20-Prasinocladus_malaysianus.AAC.1